MEVLLIYPIMWIITLVMFRLSFRLGIFNRDEWFAAFAGSGYQRHKKGEINQPLETFINIMVATFWFFTLPLGAVIILAKLIRKIVG